MNHFIEVWSTGKENLNLPKIWSFGVGNRIEGIFLTLKTTIDVLNII